MYVVDAGNYRIQKFDSNGNYILKFGSLGTADGQFSFGIQADIAISPSGDVLVTDVIDGVSDRVQRFNSSGVFQSKFAAIVAGATAPEAIAIDQIKLAIFYPFKRINGSYPLKGIKSESIKQSEKY